MARRRIWWRIWYVVRIVRNFRKSKTTKRRLEISQWRPNLSTIDIAHWKCAITFWITNGIISGKYKLIILKLKYYIYCIYKKIVLLNISSLYQENEVSAKS